jgi:ferrous iron transport protein A
MRAGFSPHGVGGASILRKLFLPRMPFVKPSPRAIPLCRLPAGHFAKIVDILGNPDHVHRLREFGLRGGMKIEMFRPGNPCIIRLAGNKVCLRSDDRLNVLVEPTAA